jgi:ACR3 family arsenite efflux pump ArsB
MIIDQTNVYSDSQAITATAASTNIVDVGAAGTAFGAAAAVARDIGKATEIPLYLSVTEAFNNLTSLKVSFQTDNYTVTGTAPTTGKMFAGVVAGRQSNP